jgi:hypothetical protein
LAAKEAELQKVQGLFQKLKDRATADAEALAAMQRKFQALSTGLMTDDSGGDSTLQDQLMGTVVSESKCSVCALMFLQLTSMNNKRHSCNPAELLGVLHGMLYGEIKSVYIVSKDTE